MRVVAQIFYGFVEPEPKAWHDEIFPNVPGITSGRYGDKHFIAHHRVPILTTDSECGARIIDPSRLTVTPEERNRLIAYVKEHHIAVLTEEPQWILAVEAR